MHALFVCYLFRSNKLYVLRLLYLAQLIKASNLINSVLRMEQDVESLSFMGTHTDCMRNNLEEPKQDNSFMVMAGGII